MKRMYLCLAAVLIGLAGCGPHNGHDGMTVSEEQNAIDTMAQTALEDLYQRQPSARQEVQNAAGVAVFSNASAMVVFVGGGGGYGVVTNNATGNRTYMKMAQADVGLGIGAKDYRQILIFKDPDTLNTFVTSGWNFGGKAGAAAKASESGGAVSEEGELKEAITVYTLTKTGLVAEASLTGYKYWVDTDLNNVSVTPRQ